MTDYKIVDVVLIDTGYDGPHRFLLQNRSQPHLGLAYIAAFLENYNYRVKIIDRIVNPLNPKDVASLALKNNPKVIGITTSTIDRFMAINILNEIKKLSSKILTVGGGPHFSTTAVDALKQIPSLDVICVGEGEITFCEIVKTFIKNNDRFNFFDIDGIVFRDSSGIIHINNERPLINNLDTLPFPAWHLFDIEKYIGTLATAPNSRFRAIGIGSSRGCPYSCAFCYNSLSKKVRYLSVSRFVDMIEFLFIEYNFRAFNFVDDSFTCNVNRVINICNEIIKRKLDINWYCSLNVNQAAKNIEMLKIMKKAGCTALGFGVEFPDNRVLDSINKKSTTKIIKKALRNVKKVDFPFIHMFLLQGLPGQNIINTLLANFRILHYRIILHDNTIYFGGFVQIYPGTQLEKLSKIHGQLDENFSWNRPYSSYLSRKYRNSPNQHNKLSTVPIYIPNKVSLSSIIIINSMFGEILKALLKVYILFRNNLIFR